MLPVDQTVALAANSTRRRVGVAPRLLALLVDSLILFALFAFFGYLFAMPWLPVVITAAYYFLEVLFGYTPGKRACSLMVLTADAQGASFQALLSRWQTKVGIACGCTFAGQVLAQMSAPPAMLLALQLPAILIFLRSLSIFGGSQQTYYDTQSSNAVFRVVFAAGEELAMQKRSTAMGSLLSRSVQAVWLHCWQGLGLYDARGHLSVRALLRLPVLLIRKRAQAFWRGFLVGGVLHFFAVSLSGGFQDVERFPTYLLVPTLGQNGGPLEFVRYFAVVLLWAALSAVLSYVLRTAGSVLFHQKTSLASLAWLPWGVIAFSLLSGEQAWADDGGFSEWAADPLSFINQGGADLLIQSAGTGLGTGLGASLGTDAAGQPPPVVADPPDDLVLTDALGKVHEYTKDPKTGKYINILTGGELDPDRWDEYNKNLVSDRQFADEQRHKLETRDTAQDRALDALTQRMQTQQEAYRQQQRDWLQERQREQEAQRQQAHDQLNSWSQTLKDTLSNSAKECWEGARWVGEKGAEAAGYTRDTLHDAYNDIRRSPEIVSETLKGTARDVRDLTGKGVKMAGEGLKEAGEAAADCIRHPEIITQTVSDTAKDVKDLSKKTTQKIYDHARDPVKRKEFIKYATGYDNFVHSWDPNRPLGERLANVGVALVKIGTMGHAAQAGTIRAVGAKVITTVAGHSANEQLGEAKKQYDALNQTCKTLGIDLGKTVHLGNARQVYDTLRKFDVIR